MATTMFPVSTLNDLGGQLLSLSRGPGVVSGNDATVAGVATGVEVAAWGFIGAVISKPLDPVTIAGNIIVNIRALETNAMANYGVGCSIDHADNSGLTIANIFQGAITSTELGTTEAARNATVAATSRTLASGDRLKFTFRWFAAGGTSASGFTATGFYSGASGATGDSFVTFTEAITERTTKSLVVDPRRLKRNTLVRR